MNYQLELDKIIEKIKAEGVTPRLLLHSCCAPCSSYCLEYLSVYFSITDLYYNPNIFPEEEYRKREAELKRLIDSMPFKNPVTFMAGRYAPEEFFEIAKGLETVPEGGERCFRCYRLRLEEAAKAAVAGNFDYFTTTLSISPLKNAARLAETGEELAAVYGVKYLPSDFKKRGGFLESLKRSAALGLYRQSYCGCEFSQGAASAVV